MPASCLNRDIIFFRLDRIIGIFLVGSYHHQPVIPFDSEINGRSSVNSIGDLSFFQVATDLDFVGFFRVG